MTARDEWAPEEVQRLRAMWPLHTARECAQALGRGVDSVRGKAYALRLRHEWTPDKSGERWDDDDEAALAMMRGRGVGWAACAAALNRTIKATRLRARKLGID